MRTFLLHVPRLACLLALLASAQVHAQSKPSLAILGETTRPLEGDVGNKVVQIEWMFSSAPASEVRFTVRTDETTNPSATPGVDYLAIAPTEVVVPAGQLRGSTALTIKGDTTVEPNELMFLKYYNFRGGATGSQGLGAAETIASVLIMNDDTPPSPPLIANNDHVTYFINEELVLFPGENDVHDVWNVLRGTVMTVLEGPAHGSLVQVDYGDGIDYFRYRPDTDYGGPDRFRYRLCKPGLIECVEAIVHLRGLLKVSTLGVSSGRTGGGEIDVTNFPALVDARYVASTLSEARQLSFNTGVDSTPHLAWDSRDGMSWLIRTLPVAVDGQNQEQRVVAITESKLRENVDLRIGIDADGDGKPSANEEACISVGTSGPAIECAMTVNVGAAPVSYWIAVHSREPTPWTSKFRLFETRMDDSGSLLKVTGPAMAARGEPVRMVASWVDPTVLAPLLSFVRVYDGDRSVGEFRIDSAGGDGIFLLPSDGSPVAVTLQPTATKWWPDRQMFFDVSPGTRSLSLIVGGDQVVEFAPHWFGFEEQHVSRVKESMSETTETAYVRVPAGQVRTITVTSPKVGRWYAFVKNTVDLRARVEVRVTLDATMPALRPGSYFNSKQSGHGLFLYPAGSQWAGLWYTYDRRGRPTWYYLQDAKPGADGIWRAPIYRGAWNGRQSRLTQVGKMQVTPLTDQRFLMSYVIDGFPGSQAMEPLGGGCPMHAGMPLDISSHWFDPARAGNGYSVQTFAAGYQFIAAFLYDRQGYPQYLVAERPDLGGDAAALTLERLVGTCPTYCDYMAPTRTTVGGLQRVLAGGSLAEITLDIDYPEVAPLEGRRVFSVTDRLQLLGGPGTTRGCSP